MKYALSITAVLLALLIAATVFIACDIMGRSDKVTVECEDSYGDRSQAYGITLNMENTYRRHLFWNTRYTEGTVPVTQTEYTFYDIARSYDFRRKSDPLMMSLDFPTGEDAVRIWDLENYYSDVIAGLEPGEEVEKSLLLLKVCSYYPLSVFINLPYSYLGWTSNVLQSGDEDLINEHGWNATVFSEFFKIPVSGGELCTVTMSRHDYRDTVSITAKRGAKDFYTPGDSFKLETQSVQSDDAFYFIFDAHTGGGAVVNTSEMKDGFGIYKLPYGFDEKHADLELYVDDLETVYDLDVGDYILELEISEDGKLLYLFSVENSILCITVIETDTYTQVQKVPVSQVKYNGAQVTYALRDGYIAVMTDRQWMHVLSRDGQGMLKVDFTAELNTHGENIEWLYDGEFAMGYDGERLVLCTLGYDDRQYVDMNVYTKDGLVYRGKYTLSLNNYSFEENISFFGDYFLTISFE